MQKANTVSTIIEIVISIVFVLSAGATCACFYDYLSAAGQWPVWLLVTIAILGGVSFELVKALSMYQVREDSRLYGLKKSAFVVGLIALPLIGLSAWFTGTSLVHLMTKSEEIRFKNSMPYQQYLTERGPAAQKVATIQSAIDQLNAKGYHSRAALIATEQLTPAQETLSSIDAKAPSPPSSVEDIKSNLKAFSIGLALEMLILILGLMLNLGMLRKTQFSASVRGNNVSNNNDELQSGDIIQINRRSKKKHLEVVQRIANTEEADDIAKVKRALELGVKPTSRALRMAVQIDQNKVNPILKFLQGMGLTSQLENGRWVYLGPVAAA